MSRENWKGRFSGRGGQGIKFLGSALVRVAMEAKLYATLSVDYTPSVRGGPIYCDVVLSSEQISYPFCDEDADIFIALDQEGFERASECTCEKTICFIDSNTINNAEKVIQRGIVHRIPLTKYADDNQITKSVNILSLGFLSEYLSENGKINLKEEHYLQVFNKMSEKIRDINIHSFQIGKTLYKECSLN